MIFFFPAVFVVSALVHLYASLKQNNLLRTVTKPFLLPSLLGWYCTVCPEPLGLVIAALLASWIGDVLLVLKSSKCFALGGFSFTVSHICFISAYVSFVDFSVSPLWAVVLCAVFYFTVSLLVFRGLKDSLSGILFYSMLGYLLVNGAMNCFALYQLISQANTAALITFIGALLFFVSDSMLFYVRFKQDTVFKSHFPVMLTYIAAEFLIVCGFILHAAG